MRNKQSRIGTGQIDAEGLIAAKETAEITFLNGRVDGSPGCGGLIGTYSLSGDELTVQAGIVLAGYCPPEDIAQARLVENTFKGDRVEEKGDQIFLHDKSEAVRGRLPGRSTSRKVRKSPARADHLVWCRSFKDLQVTSNAFELIGP
jgi:heat shock protein HslJ